MAHVIILAIVEVVMAGVLIDVGIRVLTISSRSGIDRRDDAYRPSCVVTDVGAAVHTVVAIDPDVPPNARPFVAFELTQAAPHSFCLKENA